MESPYDVLGIDPDADEREVVEAYRDRVKEAHPDMGGSAEQFRRVRTAYERIRAGDGEQRLDRIDDDGGGRAYGPRPDGEDGDDATGEAAERAGRDQASRDAAGTTGDGGTTVEYLNYDALTDHGWDLGDADLFEKAGEADLDHEDHGRLFVEPDETLLEAAENRGFAWPFACRGGACTNCAVAVTEGEMPDPPGHILTDELIDRGIRLSCISAPTTDDAKVIFNVKHLPGVDELRLPPHRFKRAHADD